MKTIKNLKAEEIRKSILQLAIQGKLVKQDPNDEPASELVKRIYEEKQRLIKEGKIKKDKKESFIFKGDDNCYYEKIGNSEPVKLEDLPFDIPDNWMWVRLKTISNLNGGFAFKSERFSNKGIRVVRISDFDENGINNKEIKYYPYSNDLSPYKIEFKDILLCMTGGTVGKSCFVLGDYEDSYINQRVALIRTLTNSEYINNIIKSAYITDLIKSNKTSTNDNISMKLIEDMLIPLPSVEEQQRIVNKINSFEPLLEKYAQAEEKLTKLEAVFPEKLKKSILQYAIEGKLVKQDPNDEPASVLLERIKAEKEKLIKEGKIKRDKNESYIYQGDDKNYYENLPQGWVFVPFESICKVITCGYASTPKYEEKGIPFISAKNVKPYNFIYKDFKYISEELFNKIHSNNRPQKDDILLTRVGAGIGEACIIDVDDVFGIYVSVTLIKLVYPSMNQYILHLLESPYGLTLSNKNTFGKDASQGNLNVNNVRRFLCPVPPLIEQEKINKKISDLYIQIDNLFY